MGILSLYPPLLWLTECFNMHGFFSDILGVHARHNIKGALMGTPNREPQEYSRNIIGIYLSGSFYSYYTPTIFLGFPVWGSH